MFGKGYLIIVSFTECTHTIKVVQCIGYVGTLQRHDYVLRIALFQFILWTGLTSATLYVTITLSGLAIPHLWTRQFYKNFWVTTFTICLPYF